VGQPTLPRPVVSLLGWNFVKLQRDRLRFLVDVARAHGDLVQLRLGSTRVFVLSHPDYIKHVLVTENRNFKKGRGTQRAALLLRNGLLTSEGDLHRTRRRMAQPAFHRQQVTLSAESIVELTDELTASWTDSSVIDVHAVMSRLTLLIAGRALFGVDLSHEADDIRAALTDVLDYFGVALLPGSELLDRLPFIPVVGRFNRGRRRLDETIVRVINEAHEALKRNGTHRQDVAMLLTRAVAHELNDKSRSPQLDQLHDDLMTILVAGYETMSDSLAWTWLLLSQNSEARARLHREIDEELGDRAPTADDLNELQYSRAVFSESLRLYPSAYIAGYEAIDDCEIDGVLIPRGALVLMCQYIVHRDSRWFEDPERFIPERWLDEKNNRERPRYAYFPFGAGQRQCIGEHFAWMEGMLIVAAIARRWRLDVVSPPSDIWATLTLRPASPILARVNVRAAGRSA
jgi:cytochrome P450